MSKSFLSRVKLLLTALILSAGLLIPIGFARAQSGQDCDDNAVIRCGIRAENLVQKYRENQGGNVQAVFAEFGMPNEAALSGMVSGRVTSTNEVYVGDKLVATNALTAGRQNMPGSTPILNGQFYRRPPGVSFRSGSLSALVKMDGETFRYAIIESCGNPVTAQDVPNPPPPPPPAPQPQPTPPPPPAPSKPDFTIEKDVRKKGDTTWMQHVTTQPGEIVEFRIVIKNTGDTELKNVRLRDKLPPSLINPKVISSQSNSSMFNGGLNMGSIAKGQQLEVVFEVVIPTDTDTCAKERLRNVAFAKPENLTEKNDDATVDACKIVTTAPPPPPPTPQPVPTPPPPPQKAPVVLADTGPGAVAGMFSITTVLGAALHTLKEYYLSKLS
jgi:uncharacterized repeat protein (TIGR01451 family)